MNNEETGRAEGAPVDPELQIIGELNHLQYRIWHLGGDDKHGDDSRRSELTEAISRQSQLVLDVIALRNKSRISIEVNENSVDLSWKSSRPGETKPVTKRYRVRDLEKINPDVRNLPIFQKK